MTLHFKSLIIWFQCWRRENGCIYYTKHCLREDEIRGSSWYVPDC